jgi:peptidoglycan/LPS O-acetylase OafA/YrhL
LVGIVMLELVTWQMAAAGNQSANAALLDRIDNTAGIVIPFFAVSFAFMLGVAVLAVGLYRARAVQSWMAAFLLLASLLLVLEFALTSTVPGIIGAAFLLVGLGSIGRMVLGESDEAWEHTPEISGFRPLPGMR